MASRLVRPISCLFLFLALTVFSRPSVASDIPPPASPPPPDRRLQLVIQDSNGSPLAARVRIRGSDSRAHPDSLDQARLVYHGLAAFFYADTSTWVNVPSGATRVTVGKGFEWQSWDRTIQVVRDTTVQITLNRFTNLAPAGWYCGDMHAHTRHDPIEYQIPPLTARKIAKAEGLNIVQLLDQDYNFTGAPDPVSDGETILYYTVEYRNGAYGHVSLPGLRQMIPGGCCSTPQMAYPMLMDSHNSYIPSKAPMMILAHPMTTHDYFNDHVWPASGLGRELPVMAALGGLDAMDVVSYSNCDNYMDFVDYYAVLSAGLPCPPSAGTDVLLDYHLQNPVGGWRVYANVGEGRPLNYDAWIDAVKAGRTFVTTYPLIPDFLVASVGPGGIIADPDSILETTVRIHALCAMGLQRISLVADENTVWTANLLGHLPPQTEIDTTFAISIPTPPWLVARVEGIVTNPHAMIRPSLAITSAIRVMQNGAPIRRTTASGRWLDNLDSLTTYVTNRGNWDALWMRDSVMAKIGRARAYYRGNFVIAPSTFALFEPQDGDTIVSGQELLRWDPAIDPESGDRISYTASVARDSLFLLPRRFKTEQTQVSGMNLPTGLWYWGVKAEDRAGNYSISTPRFRRFYVAQSASVDAGTNHQTGAPRGLPNPSRDSVRLIGLAEPIAIFDATGRRVAGTGHGVKRAGDSWIWDGSSGGHPAPAGLYWVRGAGKTTAVPIIRIR